MEEGMHGAAKWRPALADVLDALPVCISAVDAGQRYRMVNRQYEQWFGVTRDKLVGKTVSEVIGEAAYLKTRGRISTCLDGRKHDFIADIPYKNGVRRVRGIMLPDAMPHGEVIGYYGMWIEMGGAEVEATQL